MLAGVGLSSNSFSSSFNHVSSNAGIYPATLTLNNDGTTSGSYVSNTSNWYTPTNAGIGSQFWVKLTTSGSSFVTVSGSLAGGAWTQLSSAQGVTFANNGTTNEGMGSYTIQFATDPGGVKITGTISGNIDVGCIM
jgi:hypothetical protein